MKILIICTGNSCRSQMAEAFLKSFDDSLVVYSAGTNPEDNVNPFAIEVMKEVGIDISKNKTKHINNFVSEDFDYVISVCDEAEKNCPVFSGNVKKKMHFGFPDPAKIKGPYNFVLNKYREIRDQIKEKFYQFYISEIKGK